jgi:5-methylcytosine-specific restriction endonuclease McrA
MTTRREVPEWIGKTPDTALPARVKERIIDRQGGKCAIYGTTFTALDRPEFDHITALRDGGENRESNFHAICRTAHATKTAREAKDRAKVNRLKAKHLGYERKPSQPMPGSKASKWKRKMDRTTVLR